MGYRRVPKTFKLTFEDEPGLEVYCRSAPLGQILALMELVKEEDDGKMSLRELGRLEELFSTFGASLKSWNLEDEDGNPITWDPTGEETEVQAKVRALKTQDLDFVLSLILAWMDAVVGVSDPLKRKSSSGDQSPEGSIPMATL